MKVPSIQGMYFANRVWEGYLVSASIHFGKQK